MIFKAFLVALVAFYGRVEQGWLGQQMIARPIWLCTLVGLLLGNLQQGIIIGGTLELIWAGVVQVGATPTEVVTGSTVACGLAIINNLSVAEAVTIELNGTLVMMTWSPMANAAVEECNTKKIWWCGIAGELTRASLLALATFIAVSAGSVAVNSVIGAIPEKIRLGLSNASKLLPAIGIAVLMQFSFDMKYVGFFVLGFMLPTFLGFNSVACAMAGVVAALIYFFLKRDVVEEDD